MLQAVQAIIEKIQVEYVLPGNTHAEKFLHQLEHEGRFPAATNPDAYRRLAGHGRNHNPSGDQPPENRELFP